MFQGLRLTDKQRVSSWELMEGGRNPAPLSWAWFAATKVERKPLTYETAHRYVSVSHILVMALYIICIFRFKIAFTF